MKLFIVKSVKTIICHASMTLIILFSHSAIGDVIDPEKHIHKNGHQSKKLGDNGKTVFYSYTERAKQLRIKNLETEIKKLPKHIEVKKGCDFMRGGVKAKLIEKMGIALDVVVVNYGYQGSTIACVLKYIHGSNIGTQLVYSKKGKDNGMFMVFVTD